ncbi:hypothetical protein ED733_003451 [Metarhizium rileyi]|uniref:Uncharacterized protein n=1 Tax=Metarhizium rileyi (strain RCEF 4871) TaxID=1649241 RepID=A0A5C6G7P7_METRR|nr:hypothetical protein ED733_003451 [Metarhizium rileyi]
MAGLMVKGMYWTQIQEMKTVLLNKGMPLVANGAPAGAPFVIGLAYAVMVWPFAGSTISTNLARNLGTHIVAAIFFGREAFTYMHYAPVAILVNIPGHPLCHGLL